MPESFVQLPVDSLGKKLRTYDKGTPGHDQYVIPASERLIVGKFYAQTGAHLVLAAADAATAGRWWLINPVGSAVLIALERFHFMSQLGSALVAVTSPRLHLERFTFTGTASGATVTLGKRKTTDAAPVGSVRTASTGMTPTAGAVLMAFLPTASATAVAYNPATEMLWIPKDEDDQIVLAAGEGLVFRQADAGTASDTRRYVTSLMWSEFSLP